MAGFIYAIACDTDTVSAEKLASAGLGPVLGDARLQQRRTFKGPGGGACVLVAIEGTVKGVHFKPDEQNWTKSLNEKYFIGYYLDSRPSAADLLKPRQLAGHYVKLADGADWLVPVARVISGGSALPQSLVLGKGGEVVKEGLPQYAEFSAKVERLWEDFKRETDGSGAVGELDTAARMQIAIEALRFNYHAGADEVNTLKLITTENLIDVLNAVLDIPTLLEVARQMGLEDDKKKLEPARTRDGSTTAGGGRD